MIFCDLFIFPDVCLYLGYVKMLQEKPPPDNEVGESDAKPQRKECELIPLDLDALQERYSDVLRQAYMLDEAGCRRLLLL